MGNIKKSALISYIAIFFNIVSGLLYTPWMIEKLGSSDYGLYTLSISVISFFLFDFGISSAVSRYISRYRAESDEQAIANFLSVVYKFFLVLSLVILLCIIVFYFFIDLIFLKLSPEELTKFKVVYIITGFFGVVAFPFTSINGVLTGYEKFFPLKFSSLMQKILSVTFMIIFLLLGKGLYSVVLVNSVVGILVILYKLNILSKIKIKVNWKHFSYPMLKDLFHFSIWIVIIGVIDQLVVINIPVLILGATVGATSITIFALARTLYGYFWTFGDAINGLFMPVVGKISISVTKDKELNDLLIKVGRIQLIILGLLISGFIVFGQDFILLWIGKGFEDVYLITILLILPFLVLLTQEIAVTHMYMENKAKYRAYCFIGFFVLSLILSILLVNNYGAVGIALSIFAANLIFNIGLMNYYYSKNEINVKKFFQLCHMKILPIILILVVFWWSFSNLFSEVNWIILCIKGLMFVLSYCLVFWFFILNKFEKNQIMQIISGLRKNEKIK